MLAQSKIVNNSVEDGLTSSLQESRLFFSTTPEKDQWLFSREKLQTLDEATTGAKAKCLHLPLVFDTEFYTPESQFKQTSRIGLTTQIKGIGQDAPALIFAHSQHATALNNARIEHNLPPFPITRADFHFIDYLNQVGIEAELRVTTEEEKDKLRNYPILYVTIIAHFATAEILMVNSGSFKRELKTLIDSKKIISQRRTQAKTQYEDKDFDWVAFYDHLVCLENVDYQLRIRVIDTCAIHGISSYKDIASSVGHQLQYKDNLSQEELENMLRTFTTKPLEAEQYALGDLDVYEILEKYHVQWQEVYNKLGLSDYYREPKLTIGGTVRDLFLAALAKHLGIEAVKTEEKKVEIESEFHFTQVKSKSNWIKELDEKVVKPRLQFNPQNLKEEVKHTRALLSKVEGGRCRNNRPIETQVKATVKEVMGQSYYTSVICDIDISGCYGEGQRNQMFALGNPVTFDMRISPNNKYPTLRELLKDLKVKVDVLKKRNRSDWEDTKNWGELVEGLYYFRISTTKNLKYNQDFFASWFTESQGYGVDVMAKFATDLKSDSELTDKDIVFDEEYGSLKIFNKQIHNAVLTHDGLQWILAVASDRQRNELLDNLVILSGAFYPRSAELKIDESTKVIETLNSVYKKHEESINKNTVKLVMNKGYKVINVGNECHSWYGVNLGTLIVNDLLIERKKAKILYGKKSPLDTLFKLCANTLYGVNVSKFFTTSNPVVGNNITARARALAWYMEKGLHGWQSITDGCAFELNKVLTTQKDRRVKIDGETVNLHRIGSRLQTMNLSRQPLADVEYLMNDKGELFIKKENDELQSIGKGSDNAWINQNAMEHLQNTFPCVDVLHNESSSIKVKQIENENFEISFSPRIGQYSFETKDIYFAGAFCSSADYALENVSEVVIKKRGYELRKQHLGWLLEVAEEISEGDEVGFTLSDKYGDKNNPGRDFMTQLLKDPTRVERQVPAIKNGILKISEYQDKIEKYRTLGIEPGDNLKKVMLMQECSLTQFSFSTYEQYMNWKKIIERYKENSKQSLENFFLNPDGTLNYQEMVETIDSLIAADVHNPYEFLDPNANRQRKNKSSKTEDAKRYKSTPHPRLRDYETLKEKLS